jgi:carbonic anhydrase
MGLEKLVDGFNRFRKRYYERGHMLMEKLARDGAHPDFLIINCIDPRNGADIVFDASPGQQFIQSEMAAIVPPYDPHEEPEIAASLGFAIESKKIKHLIIMGHTLCSGVDALVNGTDDPYIAQWVKAAEPARLAAEAAVGTADKTALLRETERQVVLMSLKNLLAYPMVKPAVADGSLTVSGWLFDLEKGTLNEYQPEKNAFVQISKSAPVKNRASPKP